MCSISTSYISVLATLFFIGKGLSFVPFLVYNSFCYCLFLFRMTIPFLDFLKIILRMQGSSHGLFVLLRYLKFQESNFFQTRVARFPQGVIVPRLLSIFCLMSSFIADCLPPRVLGTLVWLLHNCFVFLLFGFLVFLHSVFPILVLTVLTFNFGWRNIAEIFVK